MQLIGPQLRLCFYPALRISRVTPAISHGLCCVDKPPEACDEAGLGRRQAVTAAGAGEEDMPGPEPTSTAACVATTPRVEACLPSASGPSSQITLSSPSGTFSDAMFVVRR